MPHIIAPPMHAIIATEVPTLESGHRLIAPLDERNYIVGLGLSPLELHTRES